MSLPDLKTLVGYWVLENYSRELVIRRYRTTRDCISLQLTCKCLDDVHEHIYDEGWIVISRDHALIARPKLDKDNSKSVFLERVDAADPAFFIRIAQAVQKMKTRRWFISRTICTWETYPCLYKIWSENDT